MVVFATRTSVIENDIVALKLDEVHPSRRCVSFSKVQEMVVEAGVAICPWGRVDYLCQNVFILSFSMFYVNASARKMGIRHKIVKSIAQLTTIFPSARWMH